MNINNKLLERFQVLTAREKIIVTATVIVSLWAAWDRLFWSPVKQQQSQLQQEFNGLDHQLSALQQTAIKLEAGSAVDANRDKKNKLAGLDAEFTRLHSQLSQESKKFVSPRLMAKALNDMLNQNQQLKVLKLDTLPVTTLREEKNQLFPIYKHGIALTFSGNYLSTLNYLKALESLPWRINWDSIDYQVLSYPAAETTIRVYTLSFEESWLGV